MEMDITQKTRVPAVFWHVLRGNAYGASSRTRRTSKCIGQSISALQTPNTLRSPFEKQTKLIRQIGLKQEKLPTSANSGSLNRVSVGQRWLAASPIFCGYLATLSLLHFYLM